MTTNYPSFAELSAYIDGKHSLPEKSVILTFDDGQVGFLNHGIPLLNKYKVPATSFVIGTRYGPDIVKADRSKYVCYQSHSYGYAQSWWKYRTRWKNQRYDS